MNLLIQIIVVMFGVLLAKILWYGWLNRIFGQEL